MPTFRWRRIFIRSAQIVAGVVLFKDYVGEVAFCAGESMLPTLRNEGDILFIDKTCLLLGKHGIQQGDVIVCASPSDHQRLICKRVIASVCFLYM